MQRLWKYFKVVQFREPSKDAWGMSQDGEKAGTALYTNVLGKSLSRTSKLPSHLPRG
jgi:hypothetical protein